VQALASQNRSAGNDGNGTGSARSISSKKAVTGVRGRCGGVPDRSPGALCHPASTGVALTVAKHGMARRARWGLIFGWIWAPYGSAYGGHPEVSEVWAARRHASTGLSLASSPVSTHHGEHAWEEKEPGWTP